MKREDVVKGLEHALEWSALPENVDALHAAIDLLTPPKQEEIEEARKFAEDRREELWGYDEERRTILRALDALAREPGLQARVNELEGVRDSLVKHKSEVERLYEHGCDSIAAMEAQLARVREEMTTLVGGMGLRAMTSVCCPPGDERPENEYDLRCRVVDRLREIAALAVPAREPEMVHGPTVEKMLDARDSRIAALEAHIEAERTRAVMLNAVSKCKDDRIAALEAKLARVREAREWAASLESEYRGSTANIIAMLVGKLDAALAVPTKEG